MAGRGRSMRGLELTEEEESAVKGTWRKSAKEIGKTPQAVGKLFSHEEGYGDEIAWTLGAVWCPDKGIRCTELGENLFLFSFLQSGGKKMAISEGPWEVQGDLLVVADLDPTKRLDELEFNFVPVWIRVLDLPIGLMNVETGEAIGDNVGEIIEVECDPDGSAVGRYLRIRVRMDIRKPLRRGVTMEGESEGERFWCRFKYESLPNFCYNCGLLGHMFRECDRGDWWLEDRKFGDWLRVTPEVESNPYNRYSYGGNSNSGGSRQLESRDSDGRSGEMGSGEQNALSIEDSSHVNSESELRDEGTNYLKSKSLLGSSVNTQKLVSEKVAGNQCVEERLESLSVEGKGDEKHKSEAAEGTFQEEEVALGSLKDLQQGMAGFDGKMDMEAHPNQQAAEDCIDELVCGGEVVSGNLQRLEYGSLSGDEGKDLREEYVTEKYIEGSFKRLPPTIKVSAETVLEHPGSKRGLESRTEEDKEEHKKARMFPGERTEDFPNTKVGLLSQSHPEK